MSATPVFSTTWVAGVLRRTALATVLLTGSAQLWPARGQAPSPAPPTQAGYYRMQVGAIRVTALSDGTVPQDLHQKLTNTTPAETDQLLTHADLQNPVETSVNVYLLEMAGRLVLVDTGAGDLMGPTTGHLLTALRAAGYQPAQITDVLLTHIHADHSGGLLAGDQLAFPNATVHVSQTEADYWLSDANLAQAPAAAKKTFLAGRAKVQPYAAAGKLKLFTGNVELWPGLRTVASAGHTPGHSFYALESQGQQLVFWGDLIHAAAVQFPKPSITIVYDLAPQLAAATRAKACAEAVKQGYWVAADHVSFPGIGHVRANGPGYEWVPLNYSTYYTGQ